MKGVMKIGEKVLNVKYPRFSANLKQNLNSIWYLTLKILKPGLKPGFFYWKPEKTRNPGFPTDRVKQ